MEKEKMKMKNAFMLLLGAMLVLSMAGVVSADPNPVKINETSISTSNSADVVVTLALAQSFEVTIPADITLTDDEVPGSYTGYTWVNATVHLLNAAKTLVVNATSEITNDHTPGGLNNYWNLSNSDGSKLVKYIIKPTSGPNDHISGGSSSDWLYEGEYILSASQPNTYAQCLHFKLSTPLADAGVDVYEDTLTFSVYVI